MHQTVSCKLTLILLCLVWPEAGQSAEPLMFPWGKATSKPPVEVQRAAASGYRVLSQTLHHTPAPALPVQPLSPKIGYAYGWYGSNPNSWKNAQWGRHFGFSQSYTQWSVR